MNPATEPRLENVLLDWRQPIRPPLGRATYAPVGRPYENAVEAQRQTLEDWRRGRLTIAELRNRFRGHAEALLAADPL